MATIRRWETVPQEYQTEAYRTWKDRYRTVNVPVSPLTPAADVQDGFPVGAHGERLAGFFDAEHAVEQLREVHADSGMNERGMRSVIAADLQRLYNERRQSLESAMGTTSHAGHATGPDHWRLALLSEAENASVEEHLARLRDLPYADSLAEVAKDRFADLQAHDVQYNHPIANPDRDLVAQPLTDRERFNWLYGRDTEDHGSRQQPRRATYEQNEYESLMYNSHSSDEGVAIRQIEPLPRPKTDVAPSVREHVRADAELAQEKQKEAQTHATERSQDMPPQFAPKAFEPEEFQPEPDFRVKASEDGDRYYRGTLVGTGAKLIREDDPSSMSPFATILGRNGEEHVVHGVDVPKALARAGLAVGDVIELRKTESQNVGAAVDPKTGQPVEQIRNGWIAQEHDFAEHDQDQREDHAIREADRLEAHEKAEAERFATFKVEAEAWKQRNPSEEQTVQRFADLANVPAAPKLDGMGEPVARRETGASRKLDRLLGRAPATPAEPVEQQAPVQSAPGDAVTNEVDRLRAERDQRLGLGQPGGMPEQADAHVQALTQHKSDQQVLAQTLDDAGTSMRTGFTSDHKTVYFDFKVGEHAVRGQAPWNPETIEMGQQNAPTAIDAFTAGGRLEQSLGHPVTEDTRGFVKDALNDYVQGNAVRTIEREGYVVGMPQLPDRAGLAAKLDARTQEQDVEEAGGGQRQASAIAGPSVSQEPVQNQPAVVAAAPAVQHEPQQPEQPAQQPPVPNLGGLAERLDARAPTQDVQPNVTPEAPQPKVEVEAPAVTQAVQAPTAQPVAEQAPVQVEQAKVEQTVQAQAQPVDVQQPAQQPSVPSLDGLAQRLDAQAPVQQAPAVQAEQPKVEQPVQAQAQPTEAQQPVQQPQVPSLGGLAQRLDTQAPAQQAPVQAEQSKVEQPVQAQAQPVADPSTQPRLPPSLGALASKLNADVKAYNAETLPALTAASASIQRMEASAQNVEQNLAKTQEQEQVPQQLLARKPKQQMGMSHQIGF